MTMSAPDQPAIRPFRVEVSQDELDDLRRRLRATRWPEKETVADFTQGVPFATMQELARYWGSDYDMRRFEARLNAFPQFLTEIDGLDIHFIHVKSPHENALPLIITHGWPGSVIEMLNVIGPLTDPTAHGGDAADAFDVVIPSMPGYGYSAKPTSTGWGPFRIADAWIELMRTSRVHPVRRAGRRLGRPDHRCDGFEGAPRSCSASTPTCPAPFRPRCRRRSRRTCSGPATRHPNSPPTSNAPSTGSTSCSPRASATRSRWASARRRCTDSPTPRSPSRPGCSTTTPTAWRTSRRAFDGNPVGNLTPDEVLDNITMTWVTNTGVSSGRLYWENTLGFFDVKGVTVPAAVSVFPRELYHAPRSWTDKAYPNLIYFNEVDAGNHFAAWGQPELYVSEIRAAFRSLR